MFTTHYDLNEIYEVNKMKMEVNVKEGQVEFTYKLTSG